MVQTQIKTENPINHQQGQPTQQNFNKFLNPLNKFLADLLSLR